MDKARHWRTSSWALGNTDWHFPHFPHFLTTTHRLSVPVKQPLAAALPKTQSGIFKCLVSPDQESKTRRHYIYKDKKMQKILTFTNLCLKSFMYWFSSQSKTPISDVASMVKSLLFFKFSEKLQNTTCSKCLLKSGSKKNVSVLTKMDIKLQNLVSIP